MLCVEILLILVIPCLGRFLRRTWVLLLRCIPYRKQHRDVGNEGTAL